jgi:uncharacterized protein (TIGR03437 family)
VASAAALVPIAGPKLSSLSVAGLEANRGQGRPEILFLSRGLNSSVAVTAQSILLSLHGARLDLLASNPNPTVRFTDPLPGVVNSFTGADARKWVTGIPRFATAQLSGVYPGIDVQYTMAADGQLTLALLCSPGTDPKLAVFEIGKAVSITRGTLGELFVRLGPSKIDPVLYYATPLAFQETASGRAARNVSFEVQSATRFGFQVEGYDSSLPLRIEMKQFGAVAGPDPAQSRQTVDAAGNTFFAATIADAAGKDAPFPASGWAGCGLSIGWPIPCSDVAVYKYSKAGELVYISYLAGSNRETPSFLGTAPDGALILAGDTDSVDFPVTPAAPQPAYGGPAATLSFSSSSPIGGDFFAVRLDATTGRLLAATFLGGPSADSIGETVLGADGSLYFMPKWLGRFSPQMPVTPGALQRACVGDPCRNGYAAHISPSLDRLLYGTYLPGVAIVAKLHSDGSIYYAGWAEDGFPTTPAAYQRQAAGKEDGILARLDPQGSRLLFGTYFGGADTDWILRMAVAPDGSVWGAVSSFVQCCVNIDYRLVHLDSNGVRLLAQKPIDIGDIAVDREGNLIATAPGKFTVGPDAFLANACGPAYVKLSPSGEQLFATYLPAGAGYDFGGTSDRGTPILLIGDGRFEVVEGQSMGVFAGCVTDAASFVADTISPGAIVTLFGSRMGPREGIGFQLENQRVPMSLGGTRVLVNGEPAPILFSSYWQVNVILPYSLQVGTRPTIQVESNGNAGNELGGSAVQRAGVSLFRVDDSATRPAAALNEDGTINSPSNPAKKGSRIMLFGTGGGATIPPSVAGEVTPLRPRVLEYGPEVGTPGAQVTVEYSGAAPGLVAGVTQINIKLPDEIPETTGFPRGVVPLTVTTPGVSFYPGYVTVAVSPD